MNYLRQVYFEMKHQRMMTWVSVSGTALSIFLIMIFFMADNVGLVETSPESNRHRILTSGMLRIKSSDPDAMWERVGNLTKESGDKLYGNLEGIERISYRSGWRTDMEVGIGWEKSVSLFSTETDGEFWKIFDFKFVDGVPYDAAACESGEKKVVISRSAARKLFNTDKVAGREILADHIPYVISGVIEDSNPMLQTSFGEIFFPLDLASCWNNDGLGSLGVILLMKPGVTTEEIRKQVKERYAKLNNELVKDKKEIIYNDAPYDAEMMALGLAPTKEMLREKKRETYIIYLILILLPAINLSCLTHGRLRKRVSEIGVRRAFGAGRGSIITQILGENMLITLLGGFIGLVIAMIFMEFSSSLFFRYTAGLETNSLDIIRATPGVSMLFNWETFLFALGICFVFNLLSAFVPAWRASGVEPAVAIAKSKM